MPDTDTPPIESDLGHRMRTLRKGAGLTLDEVAGRAGVSRSLLSQAERGLTTPSVSTLRAVAEALNVQVVAFFGDPERPANGDAPGDEDDMIVRKDARKRLVLPRSNVRYELLTPDLKRQVEFLWLEYGPGQAASYQPMSHAGEENAVVLEGTLVVSFGDTEHRLEAGDSISFDSGRPHRVSNPSATERTVVVTAITPPSF